MYSACRLTFWWLAVFSFPPRHLFFSFFPTLLVLRLFFLFFFFLRRGCRSATQDDVVFGQGPGIGGRPTIATAAHETLVKPCEEH